jgi:uncharacterized protein YbaR (Trm112 family)
LLSVLACPVTRTALRWDAERQELVSEAAGVTYPVRDGVPVLLIEEARALYPPHPATGRISDRQPPEQ